MFDVYLGGVSDSNWRETFKKQIGDEVTIFDPMVEDYHKFDEHEKADQSAKELIHLQEKCSIIIFYINSSWKGTSLLLEIGESIGQEEQVILCLDGEVEGKSKIERYCNFHGVLMTNTIEDLVITVEECLAQTELCSEDV